MVKTNVGLLSVVILAAVVMATTGYGEDSTSPDGPVSYRVETVKLGDVANRLCDSASDDGLHVAVKVCGSNPSKLEIPIHGQMQEILDADGWRLSVDGKLGPEFDEIDMLTLRFSPDGRHCAYFGMKDGKAVLVMDHNPQFERAESGGWIYFSPDGKRLACTVIKENGEEILILDGKELHTCDCISNLTFGPNGKRFAFVVEDNLRERLILDGEKNPWFDDVHSLCFSPDGSRFAYIASNGNDDKSKYYVISDGQKSGPYSFAIDLEYSDDGRHFSYRAKRGDTSLLVTDGVENSVEGEIVWHSPVGDEHPRIIYIAKKNGKSMVVVDGREEAQYDSVLNDSFLVSPDGTKYAYIALRGGKFAVVHNGKEGAWYDEQEMWPYSLCINNDGTRCAYVLRHEGVAVVDGQEYHNGGACRPVFSPDGRHVAYMILDENLHGDWRLIIDGEVAPVRPISKEVDLYSTDPLFSPDSQHIVVIVLNQLFLDEQAGPEFDDIIYPGPVFHPDGTIEYLMIKDDVLYRVKHIPKKRK